MRVLLLCKASLFTFKVFHVTHAGGSIAGGGQKLGRLLFILLPVHRRRGTWSRRRDARRWRCGSSSAAAHDEEVRGWPATKEEETQAWSTQEERERICVPLPRDERRRSKWC
jgi:hypothetical protein